LMEERIEEKGSRVKGWGEEEERGVRQKKQENGRENQGREGMKNKFLKCSGIGKQG